MLAYTRGPVRLTLKMALSDTKNGPLSLGTSCCLRPAKSYEFTDATRQHPGLVEVQPDLKDTLKTGLYQSPALTSHCCLSRLKPPPEPPLASLTLSFHADFSRFSALVCPPTIEEMPSTTAPIMPLTMRAWVRARRGPARSSLELSAGFPTPAVPTGSSADVLIRVSHVSLQFNTEMLMQIMPSLPFAGPWIPEIELSGEVVAAGQNAPAEVRDPGTHVVAFQSIPSAFVMGHGVLAEYVRLPGSQVARIDATVDMASASGINGSGSTALKMIRTAGVREGHTVLVNGASGSVGSVLAQLCKLRGAKVVGVASGGNEAMVRGLGVDEVGRGCR